MILSGTVSSILDEQRQLATGQPHFGHSRPRSVEYTGLDFRAAFIIDSLRGVGARVMLDGGPGAPSRESRGNIHGSATVIR